ncbi:right-handed parallel beta-helix repeat-containing protein [Sphingomonas sp. 22176]|uniref:right-handed parallel beta-helix repeat-containing protein n=1 Tax=Sphingomonas sp. 22176 TaxID=3453884 RepID=UPI003F82BDD2
MFPLLAAVLAVLAPLAAQARPIAVGTPAQLQAAWKSARPGDTILLAPGNYGAMGINDAQFGGTVTVRSADPRRPARFTRVTINNARNLTLSGIEFAYVPAPGEGNSQAMVRINNGSNITLDNLYVHGVLDGDVSRDVNGISAVNVEGLTISNSRLVAINAGIKTDKGRNVLIRGNDISFIGSDAMEIPGSNGITIVSNKVHDFRTNKDVHPDGVQCWTTREASGCKNVRILHNQFIGSPGHEPQGVFFGDEDRVGGYENIEITGNRFVCTMWHAINIYSGPKNVVIRNNEVIAGPNFTPWIRVDAPAVVEGNSAPTYFIGNVKIPALPPGNVIGGRFNK